MAKETASKTTKLLFFIIVNLMLIILLYNVPINARFLNNICLIKLVTGKPCWNCGMTRAFLSILHFKFSEAYMFNRNVIVVFPLTVGTYLYSWYKYITRKGKINERKG